LARCLLDSSGYADNYGNRYEVMPNITKLYNLLHQLKYMLLTDAICGYKFVEKVGLTMEESGISKDLQVKILNKVIDSQFAEHTLKQEPLRQCFWMLNQKYPDECSVFFSHFTHFPVDT